jgi:glutathione S-transferase
MNLFYTRGACSLVVRIVINELELKSEFESVNLQSKQTESKHDFLTINPKGSVPTLQLDNGEILTENAVILQYLADTAKAHTLLPAIGHFERYRVLEWVNYITTEVHKSFGALFNPNIPQDIKNSVFIPLIKSKFKYINNHLQDKKHLLGEHFTLPDAYLFVMLQWAVTMKINLDEWTYLTHYHKMLNDRASIRQSLKEEDLL